MSQRIPPFWLSLLLLAGCEKNEQPSTSPCVAAKYIATTCYPVVQVLNLPDQKFSSWSDGDSTYYNCVGIPDLPSRFQTGNVFYFTVKEIDSLTGAIFANCVRPHYNVAGENYSDTSCDPAN